MYTVIEIPADTVEDVEDQDDPDDNVPDLEEAPADADDEGDSDPSSKQSRSEKKARKVLSPLRKGVNFSQNQSNRHRVVAVGGGEGFCIILTFSFSCTTCSLNSEFSYSVISIYLPSITLNFLYI